MSQVPPHLPSQILRWNSLNTMLGQCCLLLVVSRMSRGHSHTTPDKLPSSESCGLEACVRPCKRTHNAAHRSSDCLFS